jgi:hypothetical protein
VTDSRPFLLTLPGGLPAGFPFVSATATSKDGSTSEFSAVCGDPDGDGKTDDDNDGLCDDRRRAALITMATATLI